MSLYNLLFGFNPACVFIAPLIVNGHPQKKVARFRDCFLEEDKVVILARLGGGNREDYEEEISILRKNPFYIADYDDDFDYTYAYFEFKIPDEWREDIKKIKEGRLRETSEKYKQFIISVFPKLETKLKELFYGKDKKGG